MVAESHQFDHYDAREGRDPVAENLGASAASRRTRRRTKMALRRTGARQNRRRSHGSHEPEIPREGDSAVRGEG